MFPCYKDAPHLERNIAHVVSLLLYMNKPWEIILVNDRSPDDTAAAIERILKSDATGRIRAVSHMKNRGRGAAFMTGAEMATGDCVGFFDIDLEVAAVYLFECLHTLEAEQADLVVGQRHYRETAGLFYRHLLTKGYSFLSSRILGIPQKFDSETGYKFFKRETLVRYFGRFQHEGWFWDSEVVTRFHQDGLKIVPVPCLFIRNSEKRSTVRPLRDALEYIKNLLRYWKAGRVTTGTVLAYPSPKAVQGSEADSEKLAA